MKLNGAPVTTGSRPSSYITLDREWVNGDTLDLRLPMGLRLEPLPHSDGKIVALMYGPTVLAGVVPDMPGMINPAKERFSEHLNARGKTDAFPPYFVAPSGSDLLRSITPTGNGFAEFRSEGVVKPEDLLFIPLHRIYEEQYAVYFPLMTADEWAAREAEIRRERDREQRLEAATVDSITPGYQQPEIEHALSAEKSEIEDFSDRKCRVARDGGWFSYEMAVDPSEAMVLIVTYWGGVWHKRIFDLLIDGQKLATQQLLTNKPGDFFDETYPIPIQWTHDKSKITLRFQSQPGDIAGGVFALRMMRAAASGNPIPAHH
jgi:hypothetical protein